MILAHLHRDIQRKREERTGAIDDNTANNITTSGDTF